MKNQWIPRVLALFFAGFISIFSLDVFGEGYGLGELLVALFMHLMPTGLLLVALAVAWKKPKWGGGVFVLLGAVSVVFFKTYQELVVFGLVSMPLLVIGGLFVGLGKRDRKE